MSAASDAFSRYALEHWTLGGCEALASALVCGNCRAGWALAEHPEWGGLLPVGWKDLVDWGTYDPNASRDPFVRMMKRAIKRYEAEQKAVGA